MSFNVQNLYDSKDDPGKNDETFLPKTNKETKAHILSCGAIRQKMYQNECLEFDWNESVVKKKLENVSATIKQTNGGKGPDIVILQEVENLEILERLRKEYLKDSNYLPAILIEGNDIRGIDVAMLSRFQVKDEPVLHDIVFKKHRKKGTERGILEATFVLPDKEFVTVLAVHLLAPSNPVARRIFAIDELSRVRSSLPKDRMVIVGGDFNITKREEKKKKIISDLIAKDWSVSHLVGCEKCQGTHFMSSKGEWDFFDLILLSKNMTELKSAKWNLKKGSVATLKGFKGQLDDAGNPLCFDPSTGKGVSDHLPIYLELEPAKKAGKNTEETLTSH